MVINKRFLCIFHRETRPPHLNPAKIHVTGSHEKKISWVLPFRHQLNGVSIYIFISSAERLGRLSFFCFFVFFPYPRKWPQILQTLDCNRTDNNPGSKPSLCPIAQRKHQPADYLVFALSTNTMQKETIGLPEQLFCCCCFFFFFFFLWLHCFLSHAERNRQWFWGVGWLMGKGSQTKLKTDKKKWIILKWFQLYVFGFLYAVKQQYILNLTNVWLYFVGRGNMATAAFFRDLRAWDWSFSFSIVIVNSHPLWTLSSCFRDDVVMFCEGTAYTSVENKHYSPFLFSVIFSFYSISLCSSLYVSDAGISPVPPLNEKVTSAHSNGEATLASDEFTGHCHHCIRPLVGALVFFTVRMCFIQLLEFDSFL